MESRFLKTGTDLIRKESAERDSFSAGQECPEEKAGSFSLLFLLYMNPGQKVYLPVGKTNRTGMI